MTTTSSTALSVRVTRGGRRRRLTAEHQQQGDHPHRADVAAAHDLQRPGGVPTRPEPVHGVGQPVQVQGAGADGPARRPRSVRPAAGGQEVSAAQPAQTGGEDGQREHGERARGPSPGRPSSGRRRRAVGPGRRSTSRPPAARPRSSSRQIGQQCHVRQQQRGRPHQRHGGHGPTAFAEAKAEVEQRHQDRACPPPAAGRVRWTGGRRPTRPRSRVPGPRPPRPRPGRTTPSSRTGTPARAAGDQEPDAGGQVRRPERRQPGDRIDPPAAGPVQRALDQVGLGNEGGVVDAGAPTGHLGGRDRGRWRRSGSRPGWCCRCPCRRSPAGPRRRRSPRPPRRLRRPGLVPSPRGSARPRCRWHRRTAGSCKHRPQPATAVRSASTPRSSTRTDTSCCRARTLTPATPARKAPTMTAVTSRG